MLRRSLFSSGAILAALAALRPAAAADAAPKLTADDPLCLRKHRVQGLADRRGRDDTQVARLCIGNLRTGETLRRGGPAVEKE